MTSPVAKLYVDRSDLGEFSQTVALNSFRATGTTQVQSFWATPVRPSTSAVQETLEISLTSTRLVNWLQFDLARYPHSAAVEYFDMKAAEWLPLIDFDTGAQVRRSIVESKPAQLARPTAVPGHRHPQHSYADHWEREFVRLKPTRFQKFRLILQRPGVAGVGPTDVFGQVTDYSLAVRDLAFGYRVASRDDVPRTLPRTSNPAYHESFASTNDLLGSSVEFSLRKSAANNIFDNTDTDASTIWTSEIQPFSHAVVNYYVDLRDINGDPQVVDQVFLDPTNNGAHVTIYHSDDVPVGGFEAQIDPLTTIVSGPVTLQDAQLGFGNYGDQAFLVLDNKQVQYDPSLPWWLGITFSTAFSEGVDNIPHTIFDCGAWRLAITGIGATLSVATGDTVDLPFAYQGGQSTSIIVSYDGDDLHLHARNSGDEGVANRDVTVPIPAGQVANIVIGANSSMSGGIVNPTSYFNGVISSLVLKEELIPNDNYLHDPTAYSSVAEYARDENPLTANAVLRFDGASNMVSPDFPWALFGGVGSKYEQMEWTPIPRDYTMQRGWMFLPPTKASFWKFEFTNLQAEPHDIYIGIPQIVKTFNPQVLAEYAHQIAAPPPPEQLGHATSAALVGFTPYRDFPTRVSTGGNSTGFTDTEVYVAEDYETGQRLHASRGENWAYQNWHHGLSAPRFRAKGVHNYTEQEVTRSAKVAYRVGLRQLVFARSSMANQQDTGQYEDMFFDDTNLAQSSWTYDAINQALTSGNATKVVAQSAVFSSQRDLRALQFAASQSSPDQLLADPDFTDPHLTNWATVGDAKLPNGGISTSPLLGTVLEITRDVVVGFWADIAPLYPTWGDVAAVTYGNLRNLSTHSETEGGIASEPVTQPPGGRLYAAGRVVADHDLSSPLYVQIVDSVTGTVLSEQPIQVKAQQITEWSTAYTIGNLGSDTGLDWGQLAGGAAAPVFQSYSDGFHRPDSTALGQMDSGQFWTASGTSLHLVANKATVTALGQMSAIDVVTPWGTMQVGLGTTVTTGTSTASVPLLQLGGYELMNDGRVLSQNTGHVVATVSGITTGDLLSFAFMPTNMLPGGQTIAGVDATVQPWSFTISRNGTYVATVSSARAFTTVRALMGQSGQIFTSFSWTPRPVTVPVGTFIPSLPIPTDGVLSGDSATWAQGNGRTWLLSQPETFSTAAGYLGAYNSMAATPAGSNPVTGFAVDVTDVYGAMTFAVTQLAATVSTSTYYIASLDNTSTNQLLLRADGSLVQIVSGVTTVLRTGIIPSGSVTSGDITVVFARTSDLSSAFKSTYSILGSSKQALIFLVNNSVVGVYSGNNVWSSSQRGLFGYNDGAGHFTIMAGFSWSPDGNSAASTASNNTWGFVDGNSTKTYADVEVRTTSVDLNPVEVRLIQRNASADTWSIDTLSLFADRIVWEFSNDGGNTFVPAYDVRNDPNGVLVFPPNALNDPSITNNQLCYRVTAFGPNAWISHLAVRPWYVGFMRCVPPRPQGSPQGPNINPHDHYASIEDDPRFKVWHQAIPRDWFFAFRNISTAVAVAPPSVPSIVPIVGEGVLL